MTSIESKGKSVDEAIFKGLTELGVGIDEVDIDIVQEGTRGFLGLGKSAVVRLTVREAAAPEEEPAIEEILTAEENHPVADVVSELAEQDEEPAVVIEQTDANLGEETVHARNFLQGLVDRMHLSAVCRVQPEDDPQIIRLNLTGRDTAALIGRRGDTLDALQYITGLVVNRDHDSYTRVLLDAENYRSKREAALQKLARRLANNVVKYGKPVRLEPMNPYERRILHAALQENPKVETYSEGTDPYRHVVIRRRRRGYDRSE